MLLFSLAGLAKSFLEESELDLPIVARKIRAIFKEDLVMTATSGVLGRSLAMFLLSVRKLMPCDVQDSEGVNSVIGSVTSNAPHISLPLVDARVKLKKMAGLAKREVTARTFQERKDRAVEAMDVLVDGTCHIDTVLGMDNRWDPPGLETVEVPSAQEIDDSYARTHPNRNMDIAACCVKYVRQLGNAFKTPDCKRCVHIATTPDAPLENQASVFLCVDKLYSSVGMGCGGDAPADLHSA